MTRRFTTLLMAAAIALGASGSLEAQRPRHAETWPAFMQRYIDQDFRANPAFAVQQGKHEYDGQLPDWSETGIRNEIARLHSAIAAAQSHNPRTLTREQRFERDYLIARTRGALFWLESADQPHTNPAYYMNNGLDPSVYVTRPYAPAATRLRAFIAYLHEIPRAARQIRANLRTPLPVSFIDYGKSAFAGFADYYPGDGTAAFADLAGVVAAVEHLASLGHQRIGLVLGPEDHVPSRRKLAGFTAHARRAPENSPVEHALFSLEGGQAATTRLLRHGVTGVICASDVLALGAIRAVRRAGLSVPGDVSVVGYDDSAFMNCTDPPLTTVRQPIESMGKAAVALLVNQIENTDVYPEELLFEPELVVRGSTGRPGTGTAVGALPPFCTQSALGLEPAIFSTRRHGHPGA